MDNASRVSNICKCSQVLIYHLRLDSYIRVNNPIGILKTNDPKIVLGYICTLSNM